MQFSKSTDYALHALIHRGHSERCNNVGIKELSSALGVSESYLSKIMSKLRQDGIVRAVPGVNGGYELARPADQISFLDVIQVIEGRRQLFECSNSSSRQHRLLAEEVAAGRDQKRPEKNECLVEKVMNSAEQHLHQYLQEHTIQSVLDKAFKRCSHEVNKKRCTSCILIMDIIDLWGCRLAMEKQIFDVAIIGGGPAGLNAALVLGRARKKVA